VALHGYAARLASTSMTWLTNERRGLDPRYAAGEFFWYFNSAGSLEMISHYAPQYVNFANDGVVHGAYGPRIRLVISDLVDLLRKSPNTRRAVIPLYRSSDVEKADWVNDTPCTLSWNFMIINDELCMIATMRSNDVWLGMPYDIFVNTCVQRFVAGMLGIRPGWYQHQVADLHLYDKYIKQAREACTSSRSYLDVWGLSDTDCSMDDMNTCLAFEYAYRLNGMPAKSPPVRNTMLLALANCVLDLPIYQSGVLEDAYLRRHRLRRKDNTSS
jgi:thymidylate synthase